MGERPLPEKVKEWGGVVPRDVPQSWNIEAGCPEGPLFQKSPEDLMGLELPGVSGKGIFSRGTECAKGQRNVWIRADKEAAPGVLPIIPMLPPPRWPWQPHRVPWSFEVRWS